MRDETDELVAMRTYDHCGRLTRELVNGWDRRIEYGPHGPTRWSSASSTTTFSYDDRHRLSRMVEERSDQTCTTRFEYLDGSDWHDVEYHDCDADRDDAEWRSLTRWPNGDVIEERSYIPTQALPYQIRSLEYVGPGRPSRETRSNAVFVLFGGPTYYFDEWDEFEWDDEYLVGILKVVPGYGRTQHDLEYDEHGRKVYEHVYQKGAEGGTLSETRWEWTCAPRGVGPTASVF